MADIQRARWTRHWDVHHFVALCQQFIAQAMALATHDESHIFRQLCIINASGVVSGLDGDDGLAFGNNFSQVGFLAEIPADIVTARSGSTAHLAQTMFLFLAQEAHLGSSDIVSQTNHCAKVVGRQQMISDEHRPRDALI